MPSSETLVTNVAEYGEAPMPMKDVRATTIAKVAETTKGKTTMMIEVATIVEDIAKVVGKSPSGATQNVVKTHKTNTIVALVGTIVATKNKNATSSRLQDAYYDMAIDKTLKTPVGLRARTSQQS